MGSSRFDQSANQGRKALFSCWYFQRRLHPERLRRNIFTRFDFDRLTCQSALVALNLRKMKSWYWLTSLLILTAGVAVAQQQSRSRLTSPAHGLTIASQPNAIVWLDEIR